MMVSHSVVEMVGKMADSKVVKLVVILDVEMVV